MEAWIVTSSPSVDADVLHPEADEGCLQASRISTRRRIDRDERHRTPGAAVEARGGAERVQILERALTAHPVQVARQVGECRIELGGAAARALLGAAATECHQLSPARRACDGLLPWRHP